MLLLIAATEPELCGHPGLVCGIGPVESAAATAAALAQDRPAAVLHVGVAGARGLEPGTIVVGAESLYSDIAAAVPVVSRAEPDPALLAAARTALPDAPCLPIVTSAAVSPRDAASRATLVEAMEGFAVLRACALAGVPALEVRVVSNEIGEQDRARWRIPDALDALAVSLPRVIAALGQ